MPLRPPRLRSTLNALLFSDLCAVFAGPVLACGLRELSGGDLPPDLYLNIAPALLLFIPLYAALGLYPGIMRAPSEELKRLSLGTSIGFLFLGFLLFLGRQGEFFSRSAMLMAWLATLVSVPLFRCLTRRLCALKPWWGYPVLLFTPAEEDGESARAFFRTRSSGLFVASSVPLTGDGRLRTAGGKSEDRLLDDLERAYPDAIVCILLDPLSGNAVHDLVLKLGSRFRRIVVKPETFWLKQSSLHAADFPCGPVLSMRQNLLDPARMRMKRLMDLLLCLPAGAVLLAFLPAAALLIRLDSRGSVFFTQNRVGRDGKNFKVFKFRTMVADAPQVLQETLAGDEKLRREWETDQKLADDPRLTRAGRILRRTSLDELPQILNVIKGEMSLVGPRPIVANEIPRYGEAYALYKRVSPGITGLWQISGRNDLSYAERVELDQRYVYNWSVWLDIYIIVRTVPALVSGKGAY
ncbi:MAG: undecaprenyl-phosphate galactose phosphotransferase WbaP [Desulfovibrio sp.]|jgi:Undecaprenyl-phosphate galactose phosphotransferase WbaP|nr:undecaprenyl-phosphate galactose phosphotransferase WbaP [Desulfovibrio sp.]